MNIIFMGTPDLAATILDKLIDSAHNLLAIVTQPDRPKGRGKKLKVNPVKQIALDNDIPILQPKKAKEEGFIKKLEEYNPDIIVVAAYGQILPKAILDIPAQGCINVHTSLLPKYRGASPIQWAIMNGDEKTGVTIMDMDVELDTGDIISQREVFLDKKETADTLHDKLAICGGDLLVEALDLIEKGQANRTKQDETKASYVGTIDKSLGNIDFSMSAIEIERRIRGLSPWPSAYTFLDGQNLKIWEADIIGDEQIAGEEVRHGEVIDILDDSLLVKTGDGYLQILEIQLAGKKRMKVEDFLRGNPISKGMILGK